MSILPEFTSYFTIMAQWGVIGYLLGSIPFGVLISGIMGLGDLRKIGSGNIGATNVLRTGNKFAAAATLILDGGKGVVAVLIAMTFAAPDAAQLAALAAFAGHCFPIWLQFKGGKGVATFLGILLAIAWPVGVAACLTWLVTAFALRISSLSALVAALLAPIWAAILGFPTISGLATALALLIFYRHGPNISRIVAGTEPKIGASKS
ncbi:MAG: glycerol-3-phosphate 1-O-acyltransferase PlsY [Paracoccaceae bacterium]|jgi:glycerol-3-phosphate acyltransferase PlsY